jgi:hypothetical protein
VVIALLVFAAAMHPLHTTMTDLAVDAARHTVRAIVRVFADDVPVASGVNADRYVASAIQVSGEANSRVAWRGCGVKRAGDVLFVCIEGTFTGAPRGLRMSNVLLCDRFDDQVNVVQVTIGAVRHSVLFPRGDGFKAVGG